jgi:hypothetical protein
VIDVHSNAGFFGDANRFVQFLIDLFAFTADMRAVVTAVARDNFDIAIISSAYL